MGRIKKTATERHEATISPYITDFIKQSLDVPVHKLPQLLASFPRNWPFPRGDLYHWINTLDRFDRILELFTTEYALNDGPQTQPFELRVLIKGDAEDGPPADVDVEAVKSCGFSDEGDRELIESVLHFTRILLERCGNRSLYASSTYLNYILNTTSLTLLKATLRVSLRLAQRYHTSRLRQASPHTLNALLAGHYNINLENVQKMANVFPKKAPASAAAVATPFKNKDKASDDVLRTPVNTADLGAVVKAIAIPPQFKQELAAVYLTYYSNTSSEPSPDPRTANSPVLPQPPATPTPARRRSNLGPGSASRHAAVMSGDESPDTPSRSIETPERPRPAEPAASAGPKVIEIDSSDIAAEPSWKVLHGHIADVPQDSQYDLLHRVRIAAAFNGSKSAVNDLVAVRILAIANLAYVYGDTTFQQRIGQPDSEEPRNTQLAQQLADLLQPPSQGQEDISEEMTVVVIMALEALSKCKSKSAEVTTALNVGVSHGVLFYVLRKVLATLAEENTSFEDHDWCKDVFELVMALTPSTSHHQQRNAELLVSAGLMGVLVDILTLRTKQAETYFPSVLNFFDSFIHNGVRDAFQSLVNAKGLDVLADLIAHEVQNSVEAAQRDQGIPAMYKTKITDYQIPFNQQQTLRQLLKFVTHMYHHNVGTNDRLLRNLIDSPKLLGALKTVIQQAPVFGSNVWSGAMNILSSFIHNEPTSYQVIAEAGLSRAFLEAITQKPITVTDISAQTSQESMDDSTTKAETLADFKQSADPSALGVLPVGETMRDIPTAFGAICLNENGMRMFQASDTLEKFFEIFESEEHVKAMEEDNEVPHYIGSSFDELVRHHPPLKARASSAVLQMVRRVVKLCEERARNKGVGAKLWLGSSDTTELVVAGGRSALSGLKLETLEAAERQRDSSLLQSGKGDADQTLPVTESQLEKDDLNNGRTGGRSTSDFLSVVCRFLQGFLGNSNMANAFVEEGGAELLLDMGMAPCNPYQFHELSTSEELSRVVQLLIDHKPHLVLPSLVKRVQLVLYQLKPMVEHKRDVAYFKGVTVAGWQSENPADNTKMNATYTVKAMVSAQVLVGILTDVLTTQAYHQGRHYPHALLVQVNLTDIYNDLIDSLGRLHSACIWEEIMMQNAMPDEWREETRVKGMGFDNTEANKVMGLEANGSNPGNLQSSNRDSASASTQDNNGENPGTRRTAEFRNTQILTYLLSQIPTGIASLFQALGKSLLSKQRASSTLDGYQRQNIVSLAEHLADTSVNQLKTPVPPNAQRIDGLAYEIVVLSSIMQMLVDKTKSRNGSHVEVLTLILHKFVQRGGFSVLEDRLQSYSQLIQDRKHEPDQSSAESSVASDRIQALALAAINLILEFYTKVVNSKNIHDAQQSNAMMIRDKQRSEFFVQSQFLVELRHTVLPAVTRMWESSVMELLPTNGVKSVIDLLRLALDGDGEQAAVKRSEHLKHRIATDKRRWKPEPEALAVLRVDGVDESLATEALFRCYQNRTFAKEYCSFRNNSTINLIRLPPPEDELSERPKPEMLAQRPATDQTQTGASADLARVPSVEMQDAEGPELGAQVTHEGAAQDDLLRGLPGGIDRGIAQVLTHALGAGGEDLLRNLPAVMHSRRVSDPSSRPLEVDTEEEFVTVDDLEDKRKELRKNLIDRCLDVLNTHTDITFELAELITTAVAKGGDSQNTKNEIGQTLANSLMSLRPEEGSEPEGKKIASYAHLLALIMQEKDFFDTLLDTLKEYFEFFAGFIKISPDQKPEETSPWIGNILLILERILAEDEQPQMIEWTPPTTDQPVMDQDIIQLKPPIVAPEDKHALFEALVEVLPRIGKDASLALSIVRILVILTRDRALAKELGEKRSMSRLFSMMKQLAGNMTTQLQETFLIVLRHIIEDEQTIRQIMRLNIQACFDNARSNRPLDTTMYLKTLSHLVLRNPAIFIEVTNDKVKLAKWDIGRANGPQHLMLKKAEVLEGVEPQSSQTTPLLERTKTGEFKAPVVENPDGVVQFLLKELSSYKDVEDKEQPSAVAPSTDTLSSTSSDVLMSEVTGMPEAELTSVQQSAIQPKPSEKPVFKADQHPIFVYRCFILQCLTELLSSYNRTKIEFINFSRKAEYQASTPSKPRSGLLNYLLSSLVPVGTLNHSQSISDAKIDATSNWAIHVIVALCTKTSELHTAYDTQDYEEPDLLYVRKFVLEHALKAYKDAIASTEPLDQKYGRLLSLAELFHRMVTSKPVVSGTTGFETTTEMVGVSQTQLGRTMYEKNFIGALTSSIAEIDLNFPNAKRAVKYILRPLKFLTALGISISGTAKDSSGAPGAIEEDEISSATSISDDEQEREETPDLFRNSTLGMFEPDRDDEDESGSDDDDDEAEEYYGDEYEEEMEYEEDPGTHEGDVVSDDDEDIGGMGEIEGMPGDIPMDIELTMDDDDDESDEDDDSDMDEDDDEDDGHDDDDDVVEIIDEITGDEENDSMAEDDEDEDGEDWEDDAGEDYNGHTHFVIGGSPRRDDAEVEEDDERSEIMDMGEMMRDGAAMGLNMGDEPYFEDDMADEDENDEEEDYDEEDVVYEPEIEDEDQDQDEFGWGWDDSMPAGAIMRTHHRHHHHRSNPFGMPLARDIDPFAPRLHRAGTNGGGNEDGTNPLLQRAGRTGAPLSRTRPDAMGDWIYDGSRHGRPGSGGRDAPLSFVSDLIQMVGPQGSRINIVDSNGAAVTAFGGLPPVFHLTGGPDGNFRFPRGANFSRNGAFSSIFRGWGGGRHDPSSPRPSNDPAGAIDFTGRATTERWKDESKILFGSTHLDKALKVVNSILRLLVPPAIEAKRQRDKTEAERKAAEEKAREEEIKRLEAEKAEKEAREQKEQQEREAREAAEAAEHARERAQRGEVETGEEGDMEGIESEAPAEAETAAPAAPRVSITIRGRELDITNLGIDLEYLEALPEDMREEVIMQQFAEQRAQSREAGEQPSEISREFLEALPPEIQQELLRQEAHDRRRREREEARRRAAASGSAPTMQGGEMDTADFFATLPPSLRQTVLMDADDTLLSSLPEDVQAEARQLHGVRRAAPEIVDRTRGTRRDLESTDLRRHETGGETARQQQRQRRPAAQMLDKAGVATLLRLMFVSMQGSARTSMHSILSDICKNTQNRAEVISILLSILQDGSADASALEKSFAQLTVRAKQTAGQKTPQPKRNAGPQITPPNADVSPLMIVQQCISTLTALAHDNPRVSSFFLSEHETSISQRTKSAKKGKGKESKASKYPLNALLNLLDRKAIIENSAVMEHLAALLIRVTEPLKILLRRAKEAEKEKEKTSASTDVPMTEGEGSGAESHTIEVNATAATREDTSAEKAQEPETNSQDKKKHRDLNPPEVPEENLALVVNIIAARECNAKTFQSTLDIIHHLSAIPGAKDTFGRELVRRAQELGESVLLNLQQLAPQIRDAKTATDVQGLALANFSPASAHQSKLLRVLLALDYLFDTKKSGSQPASDNTEPKNREDLLSTLYETSTFINLWTNLSSCLTAIRQRGNMNNVATILQPLIESFMVVCKNTTEKEQNLAVSQELLGSPAPDSRIGGLFFSFTEEHRKILNDLVRNNPKLLNGTFDVLAKNSKVLEFDNKRNYFTRRLHKSSPADQSLAHPTIQLNIRRDQIFMDSFKNLYFKSAAEIKYGKFNIRFHGEEGVDAGGVTREWFAALSRQMFNPDYALFNPVASDRTTFHPNSMSDVNPEHLTFFKFIGRIIGKALYEGRVLDCHFSRAVYKRILGKPVSLKDMETLDLEYYKSLCWILENDITDVTFETFSVDVDKFGVSETIDLIPDGRNIPVTEENKHEYVRLVVEQRLTKSVEAQLQKFLIGFSEIIPGELISIFSEQELELLISGLPDIDVDDWKNNTEYHNYQATSPQIQWFWRAVRSFDKEEKAKLLQFVTGTSKVPLNGFKELEGMNGFSKFNIHRDYGSKDRLPSSHTCFNQLDLPEYENYEALRQQMYTAMTAGSEYFGATATETETTTTTTTETEDTGVEVHGSAAMTTTTTTTMDSSLAPDFALTGHAPSAANCLAALPARPAPAAHSPLGLPSSSKHAQSAHAPGPDPCAALYHYGHDLPPGTSVSSAGGSSLMTTATADTFDLEKSGVAAPWVQHQQQQHHHQRYHQDSRRSSASRNSKSKSTKSREMAERNNPYLGSGRNLPNDRASLSSAADEDDVMLDQHPELEGKAMKILLFLCGPCAMLSALLCAYAFLATFVLLLVHPVRLFFARGASLNDRLVGTLSSSIRFQLRCIYTSTNSDGHSVSNLLLVHIASPFVSVGVAVAAWTVAIYWVFAAIVGDPDGTEGGNDGRATVLGLRSWWEGCLEKALRA
ncbi:hypothetical protein MBLNU459_g3472t1 [Dothideomycetes sp. NU459]